MISIRLHHGVLILAPKTSLIPSFTLANTSPLKSLREVRLHVHFLAGDNFLLLYISSTLLAY
jgi:hypothetical protein